MSILLPTINEDQGIGITIDSINLQYFKDHNWDIELIIVDAGSKDNTQKIAQDKGAMVIEELRRGYGRAYKTGLSTITGDIIVTGDADATYPFDTIHEYIQMLLDENLDFITTDRFASLKQGSMSVKHHFGNLMLATALRIMFLLQIRDSQSGMWIFKKDALRKVQPLDDFNDGMPFSEEIKIEMFSAKNVRSKEIPSTLYVRAGEVKLDSFRDGWKNLKFLFKKRVNFFPRR